MDIQAKKREIINYTLNSKDGCSSNELAQMLNELIQDVKKEQEKEKLSLHDILVDAVKRRSKYSINYVDYSPDTWTVAMPISESIIDRIHGDSSIRKIRIEYDS